MGGQGEADRNQVRMTRRARTERTERILVARLEELARVLERSGAPAESVARLLESASVATINAIALNLLSEEAANAIWRGAAKRHPRLPTSPHHERGASRAQTFSTSRETCGSSIEAAKFKTPAAKTFAPAGVS